MTIFLNQDKIKKIEKIKTGGHHGYVNSTYLSQTKG